MTRGPLYTLVKREKITTFEFCVDDESPYKRSFRNSKCHLCAKGQFLLNWHLEAIAKAGEDGSKLTYFK